MVYVPPPDSCVVYIIPAVELKDGYKRNITMIMDKDGDWFIDYTGAYENKQEIYKLKDGK